MDPSTLLLIGIGFLAFMLIVTIFILISYSGLFDRVEVGAGKPLVPNLKVVYKYGEGPTKKMGALFTEVTSIAPKLKCFGVYYDDPMLENPAREHQWAVGCVLAEGNDTPDVDLLVKFREEGYQMFEFPEVSHVVHTQFPCRTQLSILLGIFKVYPSLADYVKRQKLCAHPWLEIYDGETIYYLGPLAKQSEFYVPETNPDFREQQLVTQMNQTLHYTEGQGKGKTSEKLRGKGQSARGQDDRKGQGDAKGQQEQCLGDTAGSSEVTIELKPKDPEGNNGEEQAEVQDKQEISTKTVEQTQSSGVLSPQNVATDVVQEGADAEAEQPSNKNTKVPQIESKSSTPAGCINTVTDIQGRRASSSVSQGRACSAGRIMKQTNKHRSVLGQRSASESTDLRKRRIQDSGISSTTVDAAFFSDSDTLTDPECSMSTPRSLSHVSGDSSFQSEYSYPDSPYSCDSYMSESSYVSESSFVSESPYTSEGSLSFPGGGSLMDLSSDSDGEVEKVGNVKSAVSAQ